MPLGDRLRALSDVEDPGSLANRMRAARFAGFDQILSGIHSDGVLRILDIGGTEAFWAARGWAGRADVHITLANTHTSPRRAENIDTVAADASDLSRFANRSFDAVFSNSTIEHLRTLAAQAAMAEEVRRLAAVYWVQTPNYWFVLEPHFQMPGWQWLPEETRTTLLQRRQFGRRGPCPDRQEARALVQEIRLLTAREMRALFPDARLIRERIGPFSKSFVAARG